MSLNPPISDWRGQRVWMIGASSGIGRAVASLLHARGAQVCVSARQQALLDAFVREHPGSQALALDVTDEQAVAGAAQQLLAGGPLTAAERQPQIDAARAALKDCPEPAAAPAE